MKKYNEIIKEIREDNDLNQSEMGKILGVSQNTVSQYERGIRVLPIDILTIYAKEFNVSADYILGLTKNPKPDWSIKNQINISGGKNKISIE